MHRGGSRMGVGGGRGGRPLGAEAPPPFTFGLLLG